MNKEISELNTTIEKLKSQMKKLESNQEVITELCETGLASSLPQILNVSGVFKRQTYHNNKQYEKGFNALAKLDSLRSPYRTLSTNTHDPLLLRGKI